MSSSTYGFLSNEDLPSEDTIVAHCRKVGFRVSGTKLLDERSQSVVAWIKYGPNATIDEALTQDWTAKTLDLSPDSGLRVPRVFHAFTRKFSSGPIGYIAMEFIDADDCGPNDVLAVANAVQTLTRLSMPSTNLGHIGGHSLVHSLFLYWIPVADYRSVQDMNDHFNNILKFMGDSRRVDLVAAAERGLYLCPCDLNCKNFKKFPDGSMVALDFGATCFVPFPLIRVAMHKCEDLFARKVARVAIDQLEHPVSADVETIIAISNFLVPFGQQAVAFPPSLKRKTF